MLFIKNIDILNLYNKYFKLHLIIFFNMNKESLIIHYKLVVEV